jgi:glycerophosphoryl diester phosphodiesterase
VNASAPLVIAGATGYGAWPANSLEGALQCLAAPVDGIEIDVQMTLDGHVVAHHDYRLRPDQTRLEGQWIEAPSAPLKQLKLDSLRRYDVGRSRPGSAAAGRNPGREEMDGVRVPTLREIIDALKDATGPERWIYIEIKTDPQDPDIAPDPENIVGSVLSVLDATDYIAHAKIIAFDWKVLRVSRERAPKLATAHLTIPEALKSGVRLDAVGRSPWLDGFDAMDHGGSELWAIKAHGGEEWSPHFTEVTAERMTEAGDLGLRVGPWGLFKSRDIARMAELGVYSSTVSGPDWGVERTGPATDD